VFIPVSDDLFRLCFSRIKYYLKSEKKNHREQNKSKEELCQSVKAKKHRLKLWQKFEEQNEIK
jgi:hypothetical protein